VAAADARPRRGSELPPSPAVRGPSPDSIALPYPPLPELLRIELGSVSSRRSTSSSSAAVASAPPEGATAPRAYPLPSLPNSTTEYLVEEDLQVVLKPPYTANPPLTARVTGEPSHQLATRAERGLQPSSSVTPTALFRSVGWSSSRWSNRWSSGWWSSRYGAGSVTAAATAGAAAWRIRRRRGSGSRGCG
jgi:E3 ubiquitin-protein ligase ATL4